MYTITPKKHFSYRESVWPFYAILAHRTSGKVIALEDTSPDMITRATMVVLLHKIGQPFEYSENISELRNQEDDERRDGRKTRMCSCEKR